MDAPSPLEAKKFISTIEHKIKYDKKEYNIKFNSSYEEVEIIINEEDDLLSKNIFSNSFSLKQLQNMSHYFRMFDEIDDLIMNLKTLIQKNKFQLTVNDKTLIINFNPGILIKGKIEITLLLKEKSQTEKINDLIVLTQSLLKRVDKLEKENINLKEQVKDLTKKLNEHTNQKEKDIFQDSAILTNEKDKNIMFNMLNDKIKQLTLLYRGTRDGDLAKNFHEKCDYKGPTLTLCREKNKGIIFGGYTEAEWDSKGRHAKYDKNAFIFSVSFNKKFESKNFQNSIGCYPDLGPVFGFGGDLTIWDKFLSSDNNNMWSEQKTYLDKNYEILNGNRFFFLDELEVYLVNK